jgi:hypothetical protein
MAITVERVPISTEMQEKLAMGAQGIVRFFGHLAGRLIRAA